MESAAALGGDHAGRGRAFESEGHREKPYLVHDGRRFLLWKNGTQWAPPPPLALANGYQVALEGGGNQVVISRHGKEVSRLVLRKVFDEWLKDEALWGGQPRANELTYIRGRGGGIDGELGSLVTTGCSALGVVTWYELGPSVVPVAAQFLVRIQTTPSPRWFLCGNWALPNPSPSEWESWRSLRPLTCSPGMASCYSTQVRLRRGPGRPPPPGSWSRLTAPEKTGGGWPLSRRNSFP